ncbi:DUF4179 domain-containing protein [Paenibacillus eucommiae]|uniref:DUF4179 domain-containing protein n=1 Tax=Paenibacillus eucommiae TaxID=1355755 RepID=A0ABS4ISR7_9BACL|nr:DUF4179 domain-containing protein [Paenibacillus eucommiae]MBP1990608.1 hypothetical protein [Paenibacillus eucommiae]
MSISKKMNQALTEQFEDIQIPEEVDERVRQSFAQFHTKKENSKMKKKIIAFSIAAAVLIPTSAWALNTSYFAKNVNLNGLVDSSVKQAVSKGLTIPMDEKITDQGITIHFKEMVVEETKILIHYRIENQEGALVPYEFDTTGLNIVGDGVNNGKQTENPTYQEAGVEGINVLSFIGTSEPDSLPFYLTDAAGNKVETGIAEKDQPEGIIAFVTDGSRLPQAINMNISVDRIGKTAGTWKGQIPIDQSKLK